MQHTTPAAAAAIGAILMFAPAVHGGVINQTYSGSFPASISGTLPNQGTALEEMFTLGSVSDLTITSDSYASGGFEPNLLLFDSLGNFLSSGTPFGAVDPSTGIVGDMRLTDTNLPASTYTLVVTDFLLNQSLTATNLSDGFTVNFGSGTNFVDANGNTRTGAYALTIAVSAAASAAPEPATIWLAAPVLGILAAAARKRQRRNTV